MSEPRALIFLGAAVFACTALSGCTGGLPACHAVAKEAKAPKHYVMVRYRVQSVKQLTPRAEVRQADRFAALRPTWNTVAVRRPETCSQEGAGQGTGSMAAGSQTILATDCGFWLAEIERGLAKNKFSVVSWNSLQQVERTKQVPTYVAARDLGADVVFIFNSLEAGPVHMGRFGQETVDRIGFYESNGDGDQLDPLPVSDAVSDDTKAFIRERTKWMEDNNWIFAVKTMLDVTAVDTKTGEAVWFYLKDESRTVPLHLDQRFLFRSERVNGEDVRWPVMPTWLKHQDKQAHVRQLSERETEFRREPTPADAYKQDVDNLARMVIDDFLSHFRSQGD